MLRKLGDFPNCNVVEYATLEVRVRNILLPENLYSHHWEDDDSMVLVGVSPIGRLARNPIYLESLELAEEFESYLHYLFSKRKYKNDYSINVKVETTSRGKLVTRWKVEQSQKVKETLAKLNT